MRSSSACGAPNPGRTDIKTGTRVSSDWSISELEAHFAWARATATGAPLVTEPMALPHIGGERTAVVSGRGKRPDTTQTLVIGALHFARTFFHHDPPTSLEIELSIAAVEEEVMRLAHQVDPRAALISIDRGLRAWAAVAGATMTLEVVEQMFEPAAQGRLGQEHGDCRLAERAGLRQRNQVSQLDEGHGRAPRESALNSC